MRYHQTKFGCKRIISSEDRVELESKKQSYFDSINIHCDLDLEDHNRTFHSTLHLMMMHHNTKFGYKQLSGSEEDSCWIKLHTWARQMDTVIPVYSPNFEGGWGWGWVGGRWYKNCVFTDHGKMCQGFITQHNLVYLPRPLLLFSFFLSVFLLLLLGFFLSFFLLFLLFHP